MKRCLIFSAIFVILLITIFSFGSQSVFKESAHYTKNLTDDEFVSIKLEDETYSFDFAIQDTENERLCYLLYYPFGSHSKLESYWGSLLIHLTYENNDWMISNIVFENINSYPFEQFSLGEQNEVIEVGEKYTRNVRIERINNEIYPYVVEEIVYADWLGMTAGSCKISLYLGVDGDNMNFYMSKNYRKGNYFE